MRRGGFTLVVNETDGTSAEVNSTSFPPRRGGPTITVARSDDSCIVVLLGRLFYRGALQSEVRDGFRQRLADGATVSDAALALEVYRHRGVPGLLRLEGEFSLATWDGRSRRLFGMRDPNGAWPLYYQRRSGRLAVGTSLDAVAGSEARDLDLEYVAEFLMLPRLVDEVRSERTPRAGVRRVMPGAIVEMSSESSRVVDRRDVTASTPLSIGAPDAAMELRRLLGAAVAERVNGVDSVACHLSGGIDSSAVTSLARGAVSSAGGHLRTLTLLFDSRALADEERHARLANVATDDARIVRGARTDYYDWFTRPVEPHHEPYAALAGIAVERKLADEAGDAGVIMTGLGSDQILYAAPFHLADLVRRGRLREAWNESSTWGRARNEGRWTVLHRYALEPIFPVVLRDGPSAALTKRGAWPTLGRYTIPPWIGPAIDRQCGQSARALLAEVAGTSAARYAVELAVRSTTGDWLKWNYLAPRGAHFSHPFLDPRVVRFCLALPADIRATPGTRKAVLRAALRGIVPDAILDRRVSRGFDEVIGHGLNANLAALIALVERSRLTREGIVDAPAVRAALFAAAAGTGDAIARERLDRVLALVAWDAVRGMAP